MLITDIFRFNSFMIILLFRAFIYLFPYQMNQFMLQTQEYIVTEITDRFNDK